MGYFVMQEALGGLVGPIVIEPGKGYSPEPIFWSKACRQLGILSEFQQSSEDEKEACVRVRLPVMPRQTFETVFERAKFLEEREKQGLPTEQLPDGRWPDSLGEFADAIPVVVTNDSEKKSVYIDFGRSISAIGVSPSVARSIATMIMKEANELDPDGSVMMSHPELVNVARIKVSKEDMEKVGTVAFPAILSELGKKEEENDKVD